jgi:hypothetical protein
MRLSFPGSLRLCEGLSGSRLRLAKVLLSFIFPAYFAYFESFVVRKEVVIRRKAAKNGELIIAMNCAVHFAPLGRRPLLIIDLLAPPSQTCIMHGVALSLVARAKFLQTTIPGNRLD